MAGERGACLAPPEQGRECSGGTGGIAASILVPSELQVQLFPVSHKQMPCPELCRSPQQTWGFLKDWVTTALPSFPAPQLPAEAEPCAGGQGPSWAPTPGEGEDAT